MNKLLSIAFVIFFAYRLHSKCANCENVFGKFLNFTRNNITQPVINKFFTNNKKNGTVSKFPPVIEFLAQKVQSQFSNFVYEDLSRPPAWDTPVYTLAPNDPLFQELYGNSTNTTLSDSNDNNSESEVLEEDSDNEGSSSPLLFEIITDQEETSTKRNPFKEDDIFEGTITSVPLLFEIINKEEEELPTDTNTSKEDEEGVEDLELEEEITTERLEDKLELEQETTSTTLLFEIIDKEEDVPSESEIKPNKEDISNTIYNTVIHADTHYETIIILGKHILKNRD